MVMAETAEDLCKRPEIRKELERATGEMRREKIEPADGDKYWFVVHAIVLGLCAAVYFLLGAKIIPLPEGGMNIAYRIVRGAVLITIALAIARAVSVTELLGSRMLPLVLRCNGLRTWSLRLGSPSLSSQSFL